MLSFLTENTKEAALVTKISVRDMDTVAATLGDAHFNYWLSLFKILDKN